ncbi:bifunctional RNase H/acid phosphatase [Streptomyces sp. F001]|uniref:bifunctional RNase H/acid phosphatase n=1 Tax=Streptomyces sp. F001 TaxID=1510026 RepID=UPI00101E24C9|nr:bifunctional RNase H/acid phosphatase [Streptomyces sp. F001]RZB16311.1 bifunctional RNase H/acid phosphatase [Streptomyces sp. F001]
MQEFIVEADGGSRGNPGPAGYGAVVIDAATGRTLAEAAEYLGTTTNNVAEYRGLLAGLRAAHALDPTARVHVRMDSKLVVEQMSGRWKIKHPDMKPLAMEAGRVFPPGRVTYEWIPREQNKRADRLANEAMDAGARGEQWTPSTVAQPAVPEPSGPAGDATAGAARVRAALAERSAASPGEGARGSGDARADAAPAERSAASPAEGARGSGDVKAGADARAALAERSAASPAEGARGSGDVKADADARAAPAERSAASPVEGARGSGSAKADADVRAARAVATPTVGWGAPDLGTPATFVLLRHGETPLTPQKRFSGSGGTDPSLSDAGREQAERVAAALARRGTIQEIVASPLARTRETAGVVAARLGLDVSIDDGLRETDFGAWEGLTFAEVHERYPDDLSAWLASPDAEPTGGGESFAATATRIAATRDKLVAAYAGRTVLLVTHVTPIKTFVRLALGAPPESLFRMELSAASLSVVAYYADGNASVRLLNDTSHLR